MVGIVMISLQTMPTALRCGLKIGQAGKLLDRIKLVVFLSSSNEIFLLFNDGSYELMS